MARVALSWMDHPHFAQASMPLLQAGLIDGVEWSFDTAWQPSAPTATVLDAFADQGALYGHGVTLSVLSARWTERQTEWMRRFTAETKRRTYQHISEHLGFITAGDRVDGAPLPMPRLPQVIEAGRRAVAKLHRQSGLPIGLENLALAFSPIECRDEGSLLDAILSPTDGFIVLDLHNLWCRSVNFSIPCSELLDTFPAHRVKEIHLSGGSWDDGFRRDTHDGAVPAEVHALLPAAMHRFDKVEVVVVEQLPQALSAPEQQSRFQADVRQVAEVVRG